MSGFGYWSHDISGFEAPDLYKTLESIWFTKFSFKIHHCSTTYKVPWLYGDEAVEASKEIYQFKITVIAVSLQCSNEAHKHGGRQFFVQ